MTEYKIQGETLTGIADQVRRISGVEGELTPEQMTTNLLNVTPLGEYPKAEESAFGIDLGGNEYGIITEGTSSTKITNGKFYTFGWVFTASEAFSIVGLRHKESNGGGLKKLNLWNSSEKVVASVTTTDDATDWIELYFDTPINVAIGETYTVTVYTANPHGPYISGDVFNAKLTNIEVRCTTLDRFPMDSGGFLWTPLVDIIIKPVQAELPNDYQITRNTMDDIAEEVQRITGTTEKMTTAQITASLSAVVVHKDSEEVAF